MDLFKLLPIKMQDTIVSMRANPKLWANFQMKLIKIAFWALGLLIGYQFTKVIMGFISGSNTFNIMGGLITFLIMLWVFYTIYIKSYRPIRDRVMMYANKKIEDMSKIDVNKVVEDTLSHFENKEKEVRKDVI